MNTNLHIRASFLRTTFVVAAIAASFAAQSVTTFGSESPAPNITSPTAAAGTVGSFFSYQIVASNSPVTFGAGALPGGLGFNTATGVISGTPSAAGMYTVGLSATNAAGSGTSYVTIKISGVPFTLITPVVSGTFAPSTTDLANRDQPSFGSISITEGTAAFSSSETTLVDGSMYGSLAVTNTVPSLTPRNNTVVTLVFNTLPEPAGYDIARIDVYTGTGQGRAMQNYSVAWAPPGSSVYQSLFAVVNAGNPNIAELRTRTIDQPSNGAAPIATGVGSLRFTFLDTSAAGIPESMYREIDVFAAAYAPTITSPATATATFDVPFAYQVTATESPLSYDAIGLPSGLSINSTTGLISGTPTVTTGSPFMVSLSATNGVGTGVASLALTVNKASATVTLADLAHTYDGTVKSASATTSPAGQPVNFSYSGPGIPPVNAGSYGVLAAISPSSNYTGLATGALTIAPAAAEISLSNLSQKFDGNPRAVSAGVTPAAAGVSITYNGAATAPTNVGTYALLAATTNPNYAGTSTGTLTITPATAEISLTNLAQVFNGSPRPVSVGVAPAAAGVSVTYDGSATAPTNVGSYAVAATTTNPNYTGTSTGTLTITPATAEISLSNLNQPFNGSPRPVSATVTPAAAGLSVTYNGSATAPTNVGTYAVVAVTTNPNYTGTASATLSIGDTKAPVLSLPASLIAEATSGSGATVTFAATANDNIDGAVAVTLSHPSGSTFPLGTTTVNASATDTAGNTANGSFTVTVRDTTAPAFSALSASTTILWPVDRKMVPITLSATTSDLVSAVTTRITTVTSNESTKGPSTGDVDIQITGPMTLNLRAEQGDKGNDRVYTVVVAANDAAGNTATRTIAITVPRKPAGR
jgi:hypothetical protein